MAAPYLLDTNLVSDVIRHPQGGLASRITAVGTLSVCARLIVAYEPHYGAATSDATSSSSGWIF